MHKRLGYGALFLTLALVDGGALLGVKEVPQRIIVGLMGLAAALPAERSKMAVGYRRFILAFAAWGTLWTALYGLFVTISPPMTRDGGTMPIGQAFGATVLSVPLAIAGLILYVRRGRADNRLERLVALGLAAVFAAVAIYKVVIYL